MEASEPGFETVVGEPAETFGRRLVREYGNRLRYVSHDFNPETLDTTFTRSEVSLDAVQSILDDVAGRFATRH